MFEAFPNTLIRLQQGFKYPVHIKDLNLDIQVIQEVKIRPTFMINQNWSDYM